MKSLIAASQMLVSASGRSGAIPVYDDGLGPLFIHRNSMGITAIVRAQTWEDAYGICEDEFFPEASETVEEMVKEYATIYKSGRDLWDYEHPDRPFHSLLVHEKSEAMKLKGKNVDFPGEFSEHPVWQENYGFRPNGVRSVDKDGKPRDKIGHGIYAKDLNGDMLDSLTPELIAELEIKLEIQDNEMTAIQFLCNETQTVPEVWEEKDGPESRCGVDHWFVNKETKEEVYVNEDQGHFTLQRSTDE